jgi:hypothetical protein
MMDELQKAYNAYQNALHHLPNPKVRNNTTIQFYSLVVGVGTSSTGCVVFVSSATHGEEIKEEERHDRIQKSTLNTQPKIGRGDRQKEKEHGSPS